jgi:hypothetical protein
MIAVDADIRRDASVLLLPVQDMVGAIQKTESLIAELTHPNIDWKYVTTGLRNYLFDYIYDLLPHTNTVMPVVYGYLRESTLRKKASGIRACDTFFDRYILVMNKVLDGNDQFRELMSFFDSRIHDYLSLLTLLAEEKFYFENIHDRFFTAYTWRGRSSFGKRRSASFIRC